MHVRLSGGGQSAAARHYAICDDEDAYQGTISLKDIDVENGTAEYAIVLRRQAQGKGYASFATREILRIAFEELGLHKVYLNVWKENAHAVGFYEHMGFRPESRSSCTEGIATCCGTGCCGGSMQTVLTNKHVFRRAVQTGCSFSMLFWRERRL